MTGRAAATGLPRTDQHLRHAPSAPDEQPGQRHRDRRVTPPDRSTTTATRRHQSAARPARQGVTRSAPTPTTTSDLAQAPSADAPGHDPALAQRHAPPTTR